MNAGKGSRPRAVDGEKFRSGHERAFGKPRNFHGPSLSTSEALDRAKKGEVIDGHEYLGEGCWHTVDQHDQELRDDE
jgi:hypothetical protein